MHVMHTDIYIDMYMYIHTVQRREIFPDILFSSFEVRRRSGTCCLRWKKEGGPLFVCVVSSNGRIERTFHDLLFLSLDEASGLPICIVMYYIC